MTAVFTSSELLVNASTFGDQRFAEATSLTDGGLALGWIDYGTAYGGTGSLGTARLRAMAPSLGFSTGEITLGGNASAIDVGSLTNSNFVATWEVTTGGSTTIYAERFDRFGQGFSAHPLVVDTLASSAGILDAPHVAGLSNGNYVVVDTLITGTPGNWQDQVEISLYYGQGTLLNRTSFATAANTANPAAADPAVAALANGQYVVAWTAPGNGGGSDLVARIYNPDGSVASGNLSVSTVGVDTPFAPDHARVAKLADGGFVITWAVAKPGAEIMGRVYNADGTARSAEFVASQAASGNQTAPHVTALSDGRFILAWNDDSGTIPVGTPDTNGFGIKARLFAADGSALGSEFLANATTQNVQTDVAVAALAGDSFVATYTDSSQLNGDQNGGGILAHAIGLYDNVIQGNGTPSTLTGTAGADLIHTGPGDHVVIPGLGSDTIIGGGGNITALLPFSFSASTTTAVQNGNHLVLTNGTEHIELTGVQTISFNGDFGTLQLTSGNDPLLVPTWYDKTYQDVWHAQASPGAHYAQYGWHEGRDPNPLFSTSAYLAANKDVAAAGINPLDHYFNYGWKEGRDPSAAFDNALYLKWNPDVAAAGINPLQHYLQYGQAEGRLSGPALGHSTVNGFDPTYYLLANPDVARVGMNPLLHYTTFGWKEGRNPDGWFDTAGYLAHNPDVVAAHIDPLAHYMSYGWKEGRDPSPNFDGAAYLAANPDVAAAGLNPLYHFMLYGALEGRHYYNDGVWGLLH